MSVKKKRKAKALVCIAHPDDETIFFTGFISSKKYDWTAVCVTDANADGQGSERALQFQQACKKLGIHKLVFLTFPDVFEKRLDVQKLQLDLKSLAEKNGKFEVVLTHGVLGEYGHFHHQDVSYAVHSVFHGQTKILSPAYNLFPDLRIPLTKTQFALKTKLLSEVYSGESMRFLSLLPAVSSEGYVQLTWPEVEMIYKFILNQAELEPNKLKHYKWLQKFIQNRDYLLRTRPF